VKRIGILGGTSPESTVTYYRRITREYTRRFGDHGYPEILIYSVTFQRFIDWMRSGDWKALAGAVAEGLCALSDAGAELGLIATNTLHRVFDEVAASVPIPLISILDVVSDRLNELGCQHAALLGTKITMSSSFYPEHLSRRGIETVVPTTAEQDAINRAIFDELSRGLITPESKALLAAVADRLIEDGADAVVLGCTELPLLIEQDDLPVPVPVLDTTILHADAALEAAIA
jgi:aspartate racemase